MTTPRRIILSLLPMLAACAGTTPSSSLVAGRLAPCPPRPNCVSSHPAEPASRRIAPVAFAGTPADVQRRARVALEVEPRTTIVEERAGYLRAAVSTRVFGFVDDVELLIESPTRVVHLRSSARLGYADLGVNRARMERVARRLATP